MAQDDASANRFRFVDFQIFGILIIWDGVILERKGREF